AERENTGVEGKAEKLTWHKAWTAVSSGFSISYTKKVLWAAERISPHRHALRQNGEKLPGDGETGLSAPSPISINITKMTTSDSGHNLNIF
ncbi:hypothetical protein, partial [Shigella flexneri]|uniref:hypothetical protein n=1 Tax=Shigella flexneri TaxID=623 RepID=UPI0020962F1B